MRHLYRILSIILCVTLCAGTSAQVRTVTFTGRDRTNQYHIPLHHVNVFNLDQLWEEVLYYPDTTLTMGTVGIGDHELPSGLRLMQNVPNPFDGTTEFVLILPTDNDVTLEIYDISGKLTVSRKFGALPAGSHLFRATLMAPQTYLLGATTRNGQTTIKMVNEGNGGENSIQHIGVVNGNGDITVYLKNDRAGTPYPFRVGDEMKYTGYVVVDGVEVASNTVVKQQTVNETIPLVFDFTLPSVNVQAITNLTGTTASCFCSVTSDGGAMVHARGICWSTSPNPTMENNVIAVGEGTGDYSTNITGLAEGTGYYVRAYATNAVGTIYSDQQLFTTLSKPVVATDSVRNITATTATCGGTIISEGGTFVTARGVCWGTSPNPRLTNCINFTSESSIGSFTSNITGLSAHTTYYVCAYATNSVGTAYGDQRSFTTNNTTPTVATNAVTYITASTATCSGNVSNEGGATVTERGICWSSTSTNPSLDDNHQAANEGGLGTFNINLSGLAANTTYYVRAYAINSAGISYGYTLPFTTLCDAVNVIITGNTTINYGGSTTLNATGANTYQWSNGASTASIMVSPTTTTTYYVTGTNSIGCVGTASVTVTVIPIPPTVTTNTVTTFTATTAICGGIVTNNGAATITERGACWSSTTTNPTLSGSHKACGSGSGSFSFNVSGLAANTTYYVRAYAIYNGETEYGDTKTFTTASFTCGNSTTDFDGNSYNTVQIGTQCWMRENLKTTSLNNGVAIPLVQDSTAWANTTSAAYCYYNISSYGCLYNFNTVESGQLCPSGWHVPSFNEVHVVLRNALGSDPGGKMKTTGTTYWLSPNTGATNSSGFSARGGGFRWPGSSTELVKEVAVFWTATTYDNIHAYDYMLSYDAAALYRYGDSTYEYSIYNNCGLSVRCLCDESSTVTTLTVTTNPVTSFSSTTAVCGGNVTNDGSITVTERGVCWSFTTTSPTLSDNHKASGSGTGNFTVNVSGLAANTTYYVRAYAIYNGGTEYGDTKTFTTASFTCGNATTDYDGNSYNTVQLGTQCWMAKNLRTTHYSDGTSIPLSNTLSTTTAYLYYPNNSSTNVSTHGCLYNWKAVMRNSSPSNTTPSNVQGICPDGWHVPSDAEWTQLTNHVSGQSGYLCNNNSTYIAKALAASSGWDYYNGTCCVGYNQSYNNTTGFNATPSGGYGSSAATALGIASLLWSTTQTDNTCCCRIRMLGNNGPDVACLGYDKAFGLSVRCLRDETSTAVIDSKSCLAAPTVTDHEGNVYATVQIGNQCWMRDNLRTTTSPTTGTYLIPPAGTGETFTGKQARWYNNDSATYAPMNYGLLYNWNAAVDTFNTAYGELSVNTSFSNAVSVTFNGPRRGICPAGWHLPSDAEWTAMTNYVSSQSEYLCNSNTNSFAKALADSVGWYSSTTTCAVGNNPSANNATGFSAVPAGYCYGSSFDLAGYDPYFWSSSQYESHPYYAYHRLLYNDEAYVGRDYIHKPTGFSVRCVRD